MMPEEIIQELDPAETGYAGCLIPETDDGHCDAEVEEQDDATD